MKDKRYLANGFTLVEVAVASLISAMILTGVYTLLGSGVRSYDRISASVEEVGSTQSAIQILQRDLDSIVLDLPISLGEGDSGTGWDLAKGLYQEWSSDVGYGALFPEHLLRTSSVRT